VSPRAVDALGLLCPLPILRCRQALASLPPGELLELWSDDDEIERDLPAFCEGSGHELVSLQRATSPAGRPAWRGILRKALQ
jgi:tRNA 2-thiouridine synthesizing protein A